MPKKAILLNSLARGRVRASFNKYNLFNLYKKSQADFRSKSLYQQKWNAKQETRAYHGEHLTEGRFQTIFKGGLDSVAQLDASLKGTNVESTPILLQTFAVLEKRLDFVLFRSMFASSIRQARQFILHGNVFVNGIRIKYPGYTLKAGDIFNVKPEKVLEALGAKKPSLKEALKIDNVQILLWNKYVTEARSNPSKFWNEKLKKFKSMDDLNPKKREFLNFLENFNKTLSEQKLNAKKSCTDESIISSIVQIGQKVENPENLGIMVFKPYFYDNKGLSESALKIYESIMKLDMINQIFGKTSCLNNEELSKLARLLLSPTEEMLKKSDSFKRSLREIKSLVSSFRKDQDIVIEKFYTKKMIEPNSVDIPFDPKWAEKLPLHPKINVEELLEHESQAQQKINLPWQKGVYGRQDPSKSYFTPWKPRPFLAPFAILPHHIELSFKTCHGVYLRDPVARPGQSEVITPLGLPVHERAYMYYIRKGK